MLSLARRLQTPQITPSYLRRHFRTESVTSPSVRRSRRKTMGGAAGMRANRRDKGETKTEWWSVDGEMHEIGDNVTLRERFVVPRDNLPNKRRKQLRDQYMRRTRLVIKDSEHEPWCKKYMELYQELRENWERLYWDEGYSKKLAQDHANYDSAEDDDQDFSPYRRRQPYSEQMKDQGVGKNFQDGVWAKVDQIRDKFEYDREKRMSEKAFAPMNRGLSFVTDNASSRPRQFDSPRYSPHFDRDR